MTTALLVIDVQQSFTVRPSWTAVSRPDIADRVARLVTHARAEQQEVVWVLHAEPGSGGPFDPDQGHVRLMDGLAPAAGEPVLTKTSRNAFTTTGLAQLLTQRGVDRLVITGIQTEQCCETTARVAADLGYDVDFVTEATATFPIAHRDAPAERDLDAVLADPTTLGAAAIEERTEYALAGRFARILTMEQVLSPTAVAH
ncbi:cysteine hydrolase family protein [Luteipulveratus flavus]|uniref:Isochorismatase family protein n=1 Tax=Luteipulveratus flavus TaxID=3031728 RepID=A0ABT6C3Z5_9MICO|nr:isochorismatase family protein [Luteipulveratus sp. YIM 133296]MDF8263490.1 isochorismatase family protein [Luteipulveratus sp. YIM 133296]